MELKWRHGVASANTFPLKFQIPRKNGTYDQGRRKGSRACSLLVSAARHSRAVSRACDTRSARAWLWRRDSLQGNGGRQVSHATGRVAAIICITIFTAKTVHPTPEIRRRHGMALHIQPRTCMAICTDALKRFRTEHDPCSIPIIRFINPGLVKYIVMEVKGRGGC